MANHHHVTTHLTDSQRSTSKMIARTEKWISMSEFHNSARAWVLRFAATMASTSGIVVAVARGPSLALACGSGRTSSRRCVRTPLLAPCMTRRRRVPSQNSHRLAASGDGNDGDDSVSATAGDTRQDDGLDNDTYHPYETQSTYEEESTNDCSTDQALPEQSTAAKADLRVAFTNRGSDPAYARTAGVDVASREIPNRPKMSPFQDTVLNLGLISTAVLLLLGFKKAKTFFDGVPDLPEEERLRRMKVFCETQLKRVAESPESESRNNELKRLTSMKQDIEHKLKKFAAGEAKKREWNKRLRRLDERGEPVGKKPGSQGDGTGTENENDVDTAPASPETSSSRSKGVPRGKDSDGFDTGGFGVTPRGRGAGRDYASGKGDYGKGYESGTTRDGRESNRGTEKENAFDEQKPPLPGASARWVTASDYLQSAVEKTATGFPASEGLVPTKPNPPPPNAPGPNPFSNPMGSNAEGETAGESVLDASETGNARRDPGPVSPDARPTKPTTQTKAPTTTTDAPSDTEPTHSSVTQPAKPPSKPSFPTSAPKITHPDEALSPVADDFARAPNMTPEKERAVAREISQLEQMYGDDRSITADQLDAMCMQVIEKYGLADGGFSGDELYDPSSDASGRESRGGQESQKGSGQESAGSRNKQRHVSEDDPFYWRNLKAVFPIFEADPLNKTTQIMTMAMTHPGLPAYLPGDGKDGAPRRKPSPKQHAIAFQSRNDAERFVWFMRSTRGKNEGICTTQALPASQMETMAVAEGLFVTVIGEGRVDLDAGRRDLDVLADIREIGGELSLWEFAQWTKNELDEQRKPPPFTISY